MKRPALNIKKYKTKNLTILWGVSLKIPFMTKIRLSTTLVVIS